MPPNPPPGLVAVCFHIPIYVFHRSSLLRYRSARLELPTNRSVIKPWALPLTFHTHRRPTTVSNSRNRLSTRRLGCLELGLIYLGTSMFHFDTYRSCLYDCPLNKSDLGLELCANVGCKSYQNIARIRHHEVSTLWSRHEASYTHGPPCLSLTTRAHPNCPVRLSPRPNPTLRSYGGTGSEPSPLYGTPAPAGWVLLVKSAFMPPPKVHYVHESYPFERTSEDSTMNTLWPIRSDAFHPNSTTAPSLTTRSILGPTFAAKKNSTFSLRQSRISLVKRLNSQIEFPKS